MTAPIVPALGLLTDNPAPAALALVLVVLALLVTVKYRSASDKFDLDKIPVVRGADRILGHIKYLTRPDYHRQVLAWANEYGPVLRYRILGEYSVVVSDPALAVQTLNAIPGRSDPYAHFDKIIMGSRNISLFGTTDEDHWRNVRKGTAPAFSMGNVQRYFPCVLRAVDELLQRVWDEQRALGYCDLKPHIHHVTLRSTVEALFGVDDLTAINGYERLGPNIQLLAQEANEHIPNPLQALFYGMPFAPLLSKHVARCRKALSDIKAWNEGMAAAILARPEPEPSNTLLWACLHRLRHHKTGKRLTPAQLAPEVGIYTTAGFDTTASTIGWCLYAAALHPEEQEAVWQELRGAGLAAAGRPSVSELAALARLNAFVNEVMRMYPAAAVAAERQTHQPEMVGPYRVPKGTKVWCMIYATHMCDRNWDLPEAFRPARWLEDKDPAYVRGAKVSDRAAAAESATAGGDGAAPAVANGKGAAAADGQAGSTAGHVRRFIPFAEGPKNCVGQNLAISLVRCAVAMLLSRYRVALHPDMGGPTDTYRLTQVALTTKLKKLRLVLQQRDAA